MLYYTSGGTLAGILDGDWKLVTEWKLIKNKKNKKGKREYESATYLFNLANDLSESTNLTDRYPDKVAKLTEKMKEMDAEITAQMRPAWQKTTEAKQGK